jgi:hypothetical protein
MGDERRAAIGHLHSLGIVLIALGGVALVTPAVAGSAR